MPVTITVPTPTPALDNHMWEIRVDGERILVPRDQQTTEVELPDKEVRLQVHGIRIDPVPPGRDERNVNW